MYTLCALCINICCSLIEVNRGKQSINLSRWPKTPKKRGRPFRFYPQPDWSKLCVGTAPEMAEMAGCILGHNRHPLPLSLECISGRDQNLSYPSASPFPAASSGNYDHPNVHLAVPWGIVAYVQFTENRRTGLPRLHPHLLISRVSCGLGSPRWFEVESCGGFGANVPLRVFLFDHLEQVEDRVLGEKARCDHPFGRCWKAAWQLGHRLAIFEGKVHCLSR